MAKNDNLREVKIVALVTALSLLGDSMLYIALPLYWDEAGLDSLWQVGVLLSINRFVRLPVAPVVGWLYRRISLKTGLIIATVIGALTTLGYGLFSGFIAWIIMRSLWGVAWSFFRIGGLTSVALYAKENEYGKAMGAYNGLYRLGSLFGMLLGGIFVPIIGFRLVAIIFGVLMLFGIPYILYTLGRDYAAGNVNQNVTEEPPTDLNMGDNKYKLILICVSGFFVTLLIQGVLASTLSPIIEFHYGEFISIFNFLVSAALLSGLIQSGRWLWEPFLALRIGIWSDGKIGRIPVLIISLSFIGLIFGFISINISIIPWIVLMILVLIGATAITTVLDTIAIESAKVSKVSFITFYTMVQDIGAAAGPFISYFIMELESGFFYLYWGGAGIFILLAICWLWIYAKGIGWK